jgi:hypothetical protein
MISRRAFADLYRSPAGDDVNQYDGDREHKQNVDEAAECVGGDHPKKPQDEQDDENGPKHECFSFRSQQQTDAILLEQLPRHRRLASDSHHITGAKARLR